MQHIGETTLQLADGTTKAIADANILDMMDYFQVTLMNPNVLVGAFIGAMMAFLFCGLTMNASSPSWFHLNSSDGVFT